MSVAEKLKEEIIEKARITGIYRDEAIVRAATDKDFYDYDITEMLDSYSSKFTFKDDSVLIIDTEGFVYTSEDQEIEKAYFIK